MQSPHPLARVERRVRVLEDDLHLAAHAAALARAGAPRAALATADGDAAGGRPLEADDHARRRRLARAGLAHHGQRAAGGDGEADVVDGHHVRAAAREPKTLVRPSTSRAKRERSAPAGAAARRRGAQRRVSIGAPPGVGLGEAAAQLLGAVAAHAPAVQLRRAGASARQRSCTKGQREAKQQPSPTSKAESGRPGDRPEPRRALRRARPRRHEAGRVRVPGVLVERRGARGPRRRTRRTSRRCGRRRRRRARGRGSRRSSPDPAAAAARRGSPSPPTAW